MAGIGKLNPDWKGGRYDEVYLNAEICILGGGPAGIAAALAAAGQGLRVVLLETRPWLGGFYDWRSAGNSTGEPLYERAASLAKKARRDARGPGLQTDRGHRLLQRQTSITAVQSGGDGDSFDER